MSLPYLPLATVRAWEPLAKRLGVSDVARSARGFLGWYRRQSDQDRIYWDRRRDGFIKRHMAQVRANNEPLWTPDGQPTRRHLALIMWAYSPTPGRLKGRAANPAPRGHKPHHTHPTRARAMSEFEFMQLWGSLCMRAGLLMTNCTITFPETLSKTHCRNARRYAQVWASAQSPGVGEFEFAPQVLWLPREHMVGLIAHEIGHVLAPEQGEDAADRAGERALGLKIRYDKRWPGKGLQRAVS